MQLLNESHGKLLAYISSTGTQSYTLPINAVARYARLWFANTGSTWKAVSEMRVFGAPTPPQSVSKYYFLGKQRLAMRQNGKLTYLHGDHLGSASLATDAAGVTLSQQRYLPYGGLRWTQSGSVFPTDWQYTDQQRQSTHLTGIRMVEYYDYRARMYDPKIGRFISPDSVVPDEDDPQSLNRYGYALGNPSRFNDPSGHYISDPNENSACSGVDKCFYTPENAPNSKHDFIKNSLQNDSSLKSALHTDEHSTKLDLISSEFRKRLIQQNYVPNDPTPRRVIIVVCGLNNTCGVDDTFRNLFPDSVIVRVYNGNNGYADSMDTSAYKDLISSVNFYQRYGFEINVIGFNYGAGIAAMASANGQLNGINKLILVDPALEYKGIKDNVEKAMQTNIPTLLLLGERYKDHSVSSGSSSWVRRFQGWEHLDMFQLSNSITYFCAYYFTRYNSICS